jgi:hypothetical protein
MLVAEGHPLTSWAARSIRGCWPTKRAPAEESSLRLKVAEQIAQCVPND